MFGFIRDKRLVPAALAGSVAACLMAVSTTASAIPVPLALNPDNIADNGTLSTLGAWADPARANDTEYQNGSLPDTLFVGSGTRSASDRFFSRVKNPPRASLEFGSNETIKQAVMAGMGIALISAHTVAAEIQEKRLVALNVPGLPINRRWFVVKHGNKRFLPSAQALWNFVARNGKHYLPSV